jgi:hypothetical protein
VNNDDIDVISAATALVEASNSKTAEKDNRTINVIDDNKKNPIDDITKVLQSLTNNVEKNSKALNINYNALDKIIKINSTTVTTKSEISTDKQALREDRSNTTNTSKESSSNRVIEKIKESLFKTTIDKPSESLSKALDKQYPISASSNETQYYTRVFTILGKVLGIGKFAEGPEAGRLQADLKESKVTKNIISSPIVSTGEKSESGGILDMLKTLGLGMMLADILSGDFESVAQGVWQGIKAGAQAAMKVAGRVAAAVSKQYGNLKTSLSKLTTKLTSSKIYQVIKTALTSISKGIGERFSSLTTSVGETFAGIKSAAARAGAAFMEKASTVGGAIAKYAAPVISKVQSAVAPVISTGRAMLNSAWNLGGRVVDVGRRAVNTVVAPITQIGTKAINAAINAVKGSIGAAGGTLGFLGKFVKTLMPVAKRIPIISSLIELFFAKGDIADYKQERAENKIKTDQELYKKAGNRVFEGIGAVLGGAGGAALGLVGGPLGALFGGYLGDKAGRYASQFASYIIPESAISDVGKAAVTGKLLPEGETGEMQDFIIKNNQVYKFSNKDEILGMKNGGAVNELLQSSSINNEKQLFVASKQVSILEQIRDGIVLLTKNKERYASNNTYQTNSRDTKEIPAATFLRSSFNNSHNLQPI